MKKSFSLAQCNYSNMPNAFDHQNSCRMISRKNGHEVEAMTGSPSTARSPSIALIDSNFDAGIATIHFSEAAHKFTKEM